MHLFVLNSSADVSVRLSPAQRRLGEESGRSVGVSEGIASSEYLCVFSYVVGAFIVVVVWVCCFWFKFTVCWVWFFKVTEMLDFMQIERQQNFAVITQSKNHTHSHLNELSTHTCIHACLLAGLQPLLFGYVPEVCVNFYFLLLLFSYSYW